MSTDPAMQFQEFLDNRSLMENTKKAYHYILRYWEKYLIIHGISWSEAKTVNVVNFVTEMLNQNKSDSFVNNCLSTLKSFYKYMENDITRGVKRCRQWSGFRKEPLTEDEVFKLLEATDTGDLIGFRDYLLIMLMLVGGLRCCEVSRLNVEDLIMDEDTPDIYVIGKGVYDKARVSISAELRENIKEFLGKRIKGKNGPMFLAWENKLFESRLSPRYIGMIIKARMVKAGIRSRHSAHSLRHTCAITMMRMGATNYEVQAHLRHKNINMTNKYLAYYADENRRTKRWGDRMHPNYLRNGQIKIRFNKT